MSEIADWMKGVTIGQTAVFLSKEAAESIGPVQGLVLPSITSKLGDGSLSFVFLRIPRRKVDKVPVRGMHPVKMVYGTREPVFIAIWDPQNAGRTVEFKIRNEQIEVGGWPVELDRYGFSVQEVRDLPEASYTAVLGDMTCEFVVAQHNLSALEAEFLMTPQIHGDSMSCTVRLTSFGKAVSKGEVTVELMLGSAKKGSKKLPIKPGGAIDVSFELPKGEGTFTMNFLYGSKTASLPLRGAKDSQRKVLVASSLGRSFEVSTIGPGDEHRGLFVKEGARNNHSLLVDSIVGETGRITFMQPAEVVLLQTVNPVSGSVTTREYRDLTAKQVVEVPFEDFCITYIAAFINGQPYEAAVMFIKPGKLAVDAEMPAEVAPGDEVTFTITTNLPQQEVPVLVIVSEGRTVMPTTLLTEAAACMKAGGEKLMAGVKPGRPENITDGLVPPWSAMLDELLSGSRILFAGTGSGMRQRVRRVGGVRAEFLGELQTRDVLSPTLMSKKSMGEPAGDFRLDSLADVVEEIGATPDAFEAFAAEAEPVGTLTEGEAKPREMFPEVVFCKVVYVTGSQQVAFTAPDSITRLAVSMQAINGLDVVLMQKKLLVTKPLYAEMDVPLFLFAEDEATGRIHVSSKKGSFYVKLSCEGEEVPVYFGGGLVGEDGRVQASQAALTFQVSCPGVYELEVSDGENVDCSIRAVSEPTTMSYVSRTLTLLQPGDKVEAGPDDLWMKLLPGLAQQVKVTTEAAAATEWDCCHQTALKIRGACLVWLGGDDDKKRRAEAIIVAGVKREESMFVAGNGFRMYPGRDFNAHYSEPAATELYLALSPLSAVKGLSPALAKACREGLGMAREVAKVHGISLVPETIGSCSDAYLSRIAPGSIGERAVQYALSKLKADGDFMVCNADGAVQKRAETAYAAAVLLLDGQHLDKAVRAANFVLSQMQGGQWYSTLDTAAGLAMLGALASSNVVVSGEAAAAVEVNGERMSLSDGLAFQGKIDSISMPSDSSGVLAVQVCKIMERDLLSFDSRTPVEVSLLREDEVVTTVKPGDELVLKVKLPKLYRAGDFAMVMLPASLSFVLGGTQIKSLSLDFSGRDEIVVPLGVTAEEGCTQSLVVCVLNMFEQERGGNTGPVRFAVAA